MKIFSLIRGLLFGIFLISSTLAAKESSLLKTADVEKVMNQIFDQHVEQKAISRDILHNSFKVYIDQFDPDRVYLLQSEVDQFLGLNSKDLQAIESQYKQRDYSIYEKLNSLIQKSIIRARASREQLLANRNVLFNGSSADYQLKESEVEGRPFAKSPDELKERQKELFFQLVSGEKRRYGDSLVGRNEDKTLNILEKYVRNKEDQYLFRDEKDQELSKEDQENLFTMHILKALSNSLDAHTSFLDPSEAYDMRIRLEKGYKGVGVILEKTSNGIVVKRLVAGGPAKKSGLIHLQDVILRINGTSVSDMSIDEVSKLIRDSERKTILLRSNGM